jgi:hypothetical protein
MRRLFVGSAIVYATLMALCAFGAGFVPASAQEAVRPYFWLLGPPANLVHGTNFLWPFAIGSAVVAGLIFGISRSESRGVQLACGVTLLIAWAIFGFIVYAPGA